MMKLDAINHSATYLAEMSTINRHCRNRAFNVVRNVDEPSFNEWALIDNAYCRIVFQRRFDSPHAYWLYLTSVYRAVVTKVLEKCHIGA
jgi:hypothetical protein